MTVRKPTVATFKAFVRKHRGALLIKCKSSFDGMVDGIAVNRGAAFEPAESTDLSVSNTLGIRGVWLVGSSRDHVSPFCEQGLIGFEVYNCCGNFAVAVRAAAEVRP
jgi:hypothetical protein